jgi:hypothetical protein
MIFMKSHKYPIKYQQDYRDTHFRGPAGPQQGGWPCAPHPRTHHPQLSTGLRHLKDSWTRRSRSYSTPSATAVKVLEITLGRCPPLRLGSEFRANQRSHASSHRFTFFKVQKQTCTVGKCITTSWTHFLAMSIILTFWEVTLCDSLEQRGHAS